MDRIDSVLQHHPDLREHVGVLLVPPDWEEVVAEFPEAAGDSGLQEAAYRICRGVYEGLATALAMYVICRRKGQSHYWASVAACQKSARANTTDTFWAGRKRFDQIWGEDYANRVRAKLAKQGVTLGATSEYCPELADYEGDPKAVLHFDGARDYIRKRCEEKGVGCSGAVNLKGRQPQSDPLAPENCVPLAEDLVRQNAQREVARNPDLAKLSKRELRERVVAKYGKSR